MSQELYKTKIDIPANARNALVGVLNARLADAIDLATQMKQAHWNVKGPNFIALHEMFDMLHTEIQGHVDDIAERVTALGGQAEGTAAVAAEKSTLPRYPVDATGGSARRSTKAPRSATRSPRTCSPGSPAPSTRTSGSSRRTPRGRPETSPEGGLKRAQRAV